MLISSVLVDGEQGYAQQIRAGHHALTSDEPKSGGGTDTGPSPYGLLLSGLGSCTSITLRMYGDRKGWELGTIHVALRFLREGEQERIERDLRFSAPLTDEQKAKLLEIAGKTPVTRTLLRSLAIETRLRD